MDAYVSRKRRDELSNDESSTTSPSSSSSLRSGSRKGRHETHNTSHPPYMYLPLPPSHEGRREPNRVERDPRDNILLQQQAKTESVATQLLQARITQTQDAKDLEFEVKMRRLCWTTKVPREVTDKVIQAYRKKQDQKRRIRAYEVQQIALKLGPPQNQRPVTRDSTTKNSGTKHSATAVTGIGLQYYRPVSPQGIVENDSSGESAPSSPSRHDAVHLTHYETRPDLRILGSQPTVEDMSDEERNPGH